MKTLDQSHRALLENYDTFQRAQRCADEIKTYLWDIVREAKGEFEVKSNPALKWSLNEKNYWFQADAFPEWQGTGHFLMAIGIEHITVEEIITPETLEGCFAYVFAHPLANEKLAPQFSWLASRLRSLQPPKGFSLGTQDGYVFTKQLGSLKVASVSARAELKSYFRDPMTEMVSWLATATPEITSSKKPLANAARK